MRAVAFWGMPGKEAASDGDPVAFTEGAGWGILPAHRLGG